MTKSERALDELITTYQSTTGEKMHHIYLGAGFFDEMIKDGLIKKPYKKIGSRYFYRYKGVLVTAA